MPSTKVGNMNTVNTPQDWPSDTNNIKETYGMVWKKIILAVRDCDLNIFTETVTSISEKSLSIILRKMPSKSGEYVIHLIVSYGSVEFLQVLKNLLNGSEWKKMLGCRDSQLRIPLIQAIQEKKEDMLSLLYRPPLLKSRDMYGRTAMHWCALLDGCAFIKALSIPSSVEAIQDNAGLTYRDLIARRIAKRSIS